MSSIKDKYKETARSMLAKQSSLLGAAVDEVLFPDDNLLNPIISVPKAKKRVLIGPTNSAGQGYLWANSVNKFCPGVEARNFAYRNTFGFPANFKIDISLAKSKEWQLTAEEAILKYSHILIEAQKPLLAKIHPDVELWVKELQNLGISTATLSHGSDIRNPQKHAQRESESPFVNPEEQLTDKLQKITEKNYHLLAQLQQDGVPAFVSTLGLLSDVPWATWLPVVVKPKIWKAKQPPLIRKRPVVMHAPSKSIMKGSDLIDPILKELHDENLIHYVRIQNRDHMSMPRLIASSDIVVDALRIGDYGVAAVEAMAAGRVVLSHVGAEVRNRVEQETGFTVPIVEVERGGALREQILQIINNRDAYRELGIEGTRYVNRIHSGKYSADVLWENWLSR